MEMREQKTAEMRGRRDERRQEYDREMKDGGSAIISARYQEVASEFPQSFSVVRGKDT